MGTPHAAVTDQPLDAARLLAECVSPADGAALLFWGVVRAENDGRAVAQLEYHAYAAMAERQMERIAAEAIERFGTGDIRVVHRVGRLEVGEASVAIVVASPHRGAAYEASRYVIEQLKRRVPVWKREGYVEGDREWVPGFTHAEAGGTDSEDPDLAADSVSTVDPVSATDSDPLADFDRDAAAGAAAGRAR